MENKYLCDCGQELKAVEKLEVLDQYEEDGQQIELIEWLCICPKCENEYICHIEFKVK